MANGEKDFDSLRFRNIIKRYEEAQLVNEDIYMEPEELTDIAEFYYDKGNISQAIKAINLASYSEQDSLCLRNMTRLLLRNMLIWSATKAIWTIFI